MAKRKREVTDKQTDKRIKEGRGEGDFAEYKPWITIQDFSSHGLVSRIKGCKTGRIHHFLSNAELEYFFLLDWSEKVIDIKEQFPLDRAETLALSKELGVKHPADPKTGINVVMTSDFVVSVRQPIGKKDFARTVKFSKDLMNQRALEKLEIERLYWKERNIDWGIVTERDINKTLANNIKWIIPFTEIESVTSNIHTSDISKITQFLYGFIRSKDVPLRNITTSSDEKFSLNPGSSLSLVRHLIATREWLVDMSQRIQPERPLNFLKRRAA